MAIIQLGARVLPKFLKGNVPLKFTDNKIINFINLQDEGFTSTQLAEKLKVSSNDVNTLKSILKKNRYRLNREINAGNIKLKDGTIFSKTYSPVGKTGIEVQSTNKLLIKQKQVDEAAAKFNPNNPKTWKGLIDGHGKAKDKTLQFVLPKDRTARNFVVNKIKEINKKRPNTITGKFDPELTQASFLKTFGKENMTTEVLKNFSVAVNNLGKRYSTLTSQQQTKLLAALNNKNDKKIINVLRDRMEKLGYTQGQKSFKQLLNDRKIEFNKATGVEYPNPAALEFEHANAMVNALRMRGYRNPTQLANVPDNVLIEVSKDVGMLNNLGFAKASINRKSPFSKANLYERQEHPKNIETRARKVDQLRGTGKANDATKADILEQEIMDDIDVFEKLAAQDAADGFPLRYDFTDKVMYGHLPEYAMRKNPYTVPESGAQQLFDMIRGQGLEPFFEPKTAEQFLKLKDGGRVGMDSGGLSLGAEDIAKEIERALDEDGEMIDDKQAIDNLVRKILPMMNEGGRVDMNEGGRVGLSNGGLPNYVVGGSEQKPTNKVGTVESMLAGIGAGIIDIPKGAFTLGAALMDLGLGTNNAAKVEQWFDDLTGLDEKADQTVAGEMVRFLTNLGIPGAAAWKMGTSVTKNALLAKRNGNYFRITDPKLEERMKTALNAKGRIAATLGGAGAAGVSDAIFVGDPETVGTMGDLFGGGPTQLEPNDSNSASREVMNRIKFGLDGALFLGVIGGTGSSIKSAIARRNDLDSTNSTLDKFLSKLRPRGSKPQEFFEMERANIGLRAADVNYAGEVARKLDKHIDAIFPFVKNPFSKMGNKGRTEFMDELNETLLSGRIEMDVTGKSAFGAMDPDRVAKITKMMKDRGAKQADIDGVLDSFEQMRLGWAHMFSRLGYSMKDADPKVLEEFKGIIGDKFKSYLGSTYEIFGNKSLIPLLNYSPTEESVNKAVKMVQESARTAGKTLNPEEARHFVDKMVESARLPRGMATTKEKTSGIFLEVPDFFANKTVLSDLEFNPKIALDSLTPDARKVIDEVLGKVKDPMQTMLAGSGRLSLITRRNQFYEELLKKSADDIAADKKGFFYETELDAFNALGGNIKKIEIDPSRTIEAGITNPLNGKYAERGVAEAIEESAMLARDKGTVRQMYDSLILYPKATSQIAKTILSPVTHVRNFVSAGAFAGANGLIPGLVGPEKMAAAFKDAYKALQIPGARMANDEYRELLRLGVVNSNVRLGDLQRLLQDVNFGETLTAQKGLRGLMRPLSKFKKFTEEAYTAEDDFWKISSYALERQRLADAYEKVGIKVTKEALNEEAASIVRNNIPNYDMVNDFIKGLRQLPFGNFVSFPAEIMRTTTNILGRALKEIRYEHKLADGRVVNPLKSIGYKRLFGLGTTVVAVPYGTAEAAKAIYNVSEDEMDAMRRFVPEWSKNSTLIPIRDTETDELKYVDFSHANAYDTMIRPINTMINSINQGIDEGEIMKNVALGMYDATKETVSPFISESIWFEGASDIFLRGGRTREGRRLWTDETPWGEKVSITAGHLVKTQMPGSIKTFERLGLAARDEVDEYGRTFELGDELAGIAGFRAIKLDPLRSMKFKIADFRTGINNSRREFTSTLLKGGVVDPEDIVNRFSVANESLFKVQRRMFKDYYAARVLGVNPKSLDLQFDDRVSNTQLNAIKRGVFKPFVPSDNIIKAFRDNARAIGRPDTYRLAENEIRRMVREYNKLRLFDSFEFPRFENPFSVELPTEAIQTPAAIAPPTMPGINTTGTTINNNQQAQLQRGQQVFGSTDSIFGVG